jgi:hypothetical protein
LREATTSPVANKPAFLAGVFLITFSALVFQIVQTRILSVMAWYYLAFFAISVAMLGMTIGAVWVYLRSKELRPETLPANLAKHALACAISIPASLMVQFSLITTLALTVTSVIAWSLLMAAMAVPYVFAGIVVTLALTRSPLPVTQVYGVDLLGAAFGCVAVIAFLSVLDAPTAVIFAGLLAAVSAHCFAVSASEPERRKLRLRPWWQRSVPVAAALLTAVLLNGLTPVGLRPVLVKDRLERSGLDRFEQWNSYSRVLATRPITGRPHLWGPSPKLSNDLVTQEALLNIDGLAGTSMHHYDGTRESIDFLRYDVVNLAYNLPGIDKAAVIGVGGGRDVLAAHLFGVPEIVGVELNPIFVNLHTTDPFYKPFSNLTALPNLQLHIDDARSWFASTEQRFDLIQMSMIDTWAATGAGAFSLSENGLYTLEGWRAFLNSLNDRGFFTVSRWYNPEDINETGRMIGLATAALLDAGARDAQPHLFVARADRIATLVLAKHTFTPAELVALRSATEQLGFSVLLAPDQTPESELLAAMVRSKDVAGLNRVASSAYLDLTVPTDDRPFFFNQMRFSGIPRAVAHVLARGTSAGVARGNLLAAAALVLILFISIGAVTGTIIIPLRGAARHYSRSLIAAGTAYFSLIGLGFMLAEISLLQYFSIYLGHPVYSLGVCLFSLILATGLGSLTSNRVNIASSRGLLIWGVAVLTYLLGLQQWLTDVFHATTHRELLFRIAVSLVTVMPLGFLLGFAFPTGMKLVEAVDRGPTPWFWGINGATGVMASVLAVMLSLAFGIRVTLAVSALCYLLLIPTSRALLRLQRGQRARGAGARGLVPG